MRGAGNSTANTRNNTVTPPARLLDLTRLTSRAGRPMTGVDRVEFAYLTYGLTDDVPLHGLIRTSVGYILLDQEGCREFRIRLMTNDWDQPGLLSRLARRGDPARAGVEATLRKMARGRTVKSSLGKLLKRHLMPGTHYINTGHTMLDAHTVNGLRQVLDLKIAFLVHDTIPLDYPQYQRACTVETFRVLLSRAADNADLLIANSQQTARDIARHCPSAPPVVVAHLGVQIPRCGTPPEGPWNKDNYFVTLGTIEPRKNHALLLDVWQDLGDDAPDLLIIGSRGWENRETLARLDAKPPHIHVLSGLNDDQVFGLMKNARALLFPSHAEGFGLPPVEAAALGLPVIVHELPIYHEVLGDKAIYADIGDRYLWRQYIERLAQSGDAQIDGLIDHTIQFVPPNWEDHFKVVFTHI